MYLALLPLCVVSSFSPWGKREGAAQGTFLLLFWFMGTLKNNVWVSPLKAWIFGI